MLTRAIPSTGERLPAIGCGTWQAFDVGASQQPHLRRVLDELFLAGGSLVDTSPMYGAAESVAGSLLRSMGASARAFVATKVWTRGRLAGIAQMERSIQLLGRVDLLQIHNLVDWPTHLDTLRAMKAEGRVRYLGVTHYTPSAHDDVEAVMRAERLDFVQVNLSIVDRAAERRLLPLAMDRGVAVIVNLPFGGGDLFRTLASRPLPPIAGELGCATWAAYFLRFLLGHPAVTCVIPGSGDPAHVRESMAAGLGPIPDAATRERMATAIAI